MAARCAAVSGQNSSTIMSNSGGDAGRHSRRASSDTLWTDRARGSPEKSRGTRSAVSLSLNWGGHCTAISTLGCGAPE